MVLEGEKVGLAQLLDILADKYETLLRNTAVCKSAGIANEEQVKQVDDLIITNSGILFDKLRSGVLGIWLHLMMNYMQFNMPTFEARTPIAKHSKPHLKSVIQEN